MRTAVLAVYGVICVWCVLYWASKRTPSGTWALLTPGAFVWVVQLACVSLVWFRHMGLLHLLWLVPVSEIGYLIIAKVLYSTGVFRSGV